MTYRFGKRIEATEIFFRQLLGDVSKPQPALMDSKTDLFYRKVNEKVIIENSARC